MSLIVNGVTVDKVIVNGTEIQELSVNGTVVYKVNSSVPIATVYSLVDTNEAYSQMVNTDNVVDFGLLDYNINNMPYVSNKIFANKGYKTFIWNMDSINMFYNTNKQTWIESGNSDDTIYNAVSNYKIPISFFQFTDSPTFITTYDTVKTQSDDGSLDLSSYSYVCHGPMLNYILGQDNLLFGVHYEIKDEIFKDISNWSSTSAHIIGVEYIPSDLDTTILSGIVEQIASYSSQMVSNNNIIVWFIQSNNSLQQWDNLYQILQNAFSSTNFNTDAICLMPPQLLQNQSDWEEYFNQLMDGQLGRNFKVMIVPFTTTSYAKAQGWTWSTAASKFAQQTVGSLTSYDNAYNGQSFAHGIVVLDDINSQIKSKLYDIVYNGLGESSDVPYGIFLIDNLYQLYTFPNSFVRPSGIAIDRFDMSSDELFANNLNLTVGKYNHIILSYGLQYLVTKVTDLMDNGTIQPFTQLLISKEKEKCNATNLSDTEFLQKILQLSQQIQETNIQVIAIDSDGNGGQLVGGA